MSGHGFGEEPPEPTAVEPKPDRILSVTAWLLRDVVGRTITGASHNRHGLRLRLDNGEEIEIYSYLQKKNPQPIFIRNTNWGKLP